MIHQQGDASATLVSLALQTSVGVAAKVTTKAPVVAVCATSKYFRLQNDY